MYKLWKSILAGTAAMGICLSACADAELTGAHVLAIEQQLYALGYHGETCDSQLDEGTRCALRSLQIANGLEVTGQPDSATLELLSSGEVVSCNEYLNMLAADYQGMPLLQSGSVGDAVMWMQQALRNLGYFDGSCDGVFGDATQAAVRSFQMANGLTETGMADQSVQMRLYEGEPLSWKAFLESAACAVGDSGQHVRRMQRMLETFGYFYGECTGSYGDMTQQAVAQFQEKNGLEKTGIADYATCEKLYSGTAVVLRAEDTLRKGASGEDVSVIQSRLVELGYFDHAPNGVYGATTVTAIRLFQMANGLPSTGETDAATYQKLQENGAAAMDQMRENFLNQVNVQDRTAQAVMGNVAIRMRGQAFEADDDELFEGFSFVQYVCVASGIPVVSVDDVIEKIDKQVVDFSEPEPGDVLAIRTDDSEGMHLLLGVSSGDGRVVYATRDRGYVLESYLRDLPENEIYRWDMETVGE